MPGSNTIIAFVTSTDCDRACEFYADTPGIGLIAEELFALLFRVGGNHFATIFCRATSTMTLARATPDRDTHKEKKTWPTKAITNP